MRTHIVLIGTVLTIFGLLFGWTACPGFFGAATQAQDKTAPAPATRPADDKAIREASQGLARAFEKGDAKAVAAFWTEEGEYLSETAEPIRGRAALEKAYGDFFAKRKEVKVEGKTDAVRFLGKDTAIEEGTFSVKGKEGAPKSSRYTALYARENGKWLVATLKEWSEDPAVSLDDLAFLIGSWKSDTDEGTAEITYEWTENKKFIRARYSVTLKKDKTKSSGSQVLGLDPVSGQIRAWTFDNDGGIGQALWTFDGERWVIDSRGTLPDGSETTAVNFLKRAGDDEFTWRSVQRTVDNERLPDIAAVSVKRVTK